MAKKKVPSPTPYQSSPWGRGRSGTRQAVIKGRGMHVGADMPDGTPMPKDMQKMMGKMMGGWKTGPKKVK